MFCPYCGNQIPDESIFCGNCGADLRGRNEAGPSLQQVNVQQPIYMQPAQTPVSSQPSITTQSAVSAASEKKTGRVWPAACGVMGVLALVFYITGFLIPMIFDTYRFGSPLTVIVFILMGVIFFIHTRKIPWITILPFLIMEFFEIYAAFNISGLPFLNLKDWRIILYLLGYIIPLLLFVFYVMVMLIRPRGAALKVFYFIFMAVEIILLLFGSVSVTIQNENSLFNLFFIFMSRLSFIFFYIGHAVAVMNVPARQKKSV